MSVQAPPPVRIEFEGPQDAGRLVAGVTVLGRIVRELQFAGFSQVYITLPEGADLPHRCLSDAARLTPEITLQVGEVSKEPVLRLAPTWLVGSGDFKQLLESGKGALQHQGEVVAELVPPQAGGAIDCDALRLDETQAATRILQATVKPLDGPVSRYINRPISRRFSRLLLRYPAITPMHATLATALVGLAMFVALVSGQVWSLAVGGLLYQAASIVDGIDGEMARASFRTSRLGGTLDSCTDIATNLAFLLGLVIVAFQTGNERALYFGVFAFGGLPIGLLVIGSHVSRHSRPLSFDLLKEGRVGGENPTPWKRLVAIMTALSSRDVYALVFSLLALAGLLTTLLLLYAVAVAIWLCVVIHLLLIRKSAAG